MKKLFLLKAKLYAKLIAFGALIESPLLLAIRLYMANIFLNSGWGKFQNYLNDDWSTTVYLFEEVHPVPFLSPEIAAIFGTGGEVILGGLLIAGLLGRFAALGLVLMTAVIEFSLPADYGNFTDLHTSWALLLAIVVARGPGFFSADRFLKKRIEPMFGQSE